MKALSLWQPWASAVALGVKRGETRSWPTKHRGFLAIHAAKKDSMDLRMLSHRFPFLESLSGAKRPLPLGAIVAVVNVSGCKRTEEVRASLGQDRRFSDRPGLGWTERDMGDFSGGRFYWPFSSVHALKSPIEVRGRQGIWTLDEATERLIYEQLPTEWHAKAIRAEERA